MALTNPKALEALIADTARADRLAFKALYDATSAKLFGVVVRICRDRELAQEALQEAFLKVWTKAASYNPASGRPTTWLASIARNTAIDAIRRRREIALGMDEDGRAVIDAYESAAETSDPNDLRALRVCLEGLEEPQRDCILLAYLGGYSREDLGRRFEKPVGTIKTWLHRGLARLRNCLGE